MRYAIFIVLLTLTTQAQDWRRIDDVVGYGYKELFVLDDSAVYVASLYGLYRSVDGGGFWREVVSPGRPETISSVVPDPASSPQGLVLSSYTRIDDKGTAAVYSSTDAGVTWNYHGGVVGNSGSYALPAGMGGFYMRCSPDYLVHLDRFGFARKYIEGIPTAEIRHVRNIATFDDNRALAYTHPGTVYVSGNGWNPWYQDWTPANAGIKDDVILHIHTEGDDAWAGTVFNGIKHAKRPDFQWSDASGGLGVRGEPSMYVRSIFRDKRGPLVALTYNGYYRSVDGVNWTPVGGVLPDWEKPGRTAIDFHGRYYVLYGSDSVLVSGDEARTWSLRMTGLEMDSVRDIVIQDGELLAAGAQCVFGASARSWGYSTLAWTQRIGGLSSPRIRLFALLPDTSVLAVDDAGLISRRRHRDSPWTPASRDLFGETVRCVAAGTDGVILAGTEAGLVFVSDDGGVKWTATNPGAGAIPITAVLPVSDRLWFAGTFGGGLYRSSDAGASWSRTSDGLTHPNITALARTPDGDIFAGSYGGGVFRSVDSGFSWAPTSAAVPGSYVTVLVSNHIGMIAAATHDAGVFFTRNKGVSWSPSNTGLEDTRIMRLLDYPLEGYLFSVSAGGALLRKYGGLPTSAHETPNPQGFVLHAVYPNPFRDAITVEFELRRPGAVRLSLHDMLGREVARLDEEFATAGPCHRTLRTVSFPPGVYLLAVESGGTRQTQLVMNFR